MGFIAQVISKPHLPPKKSRPIFYVKSLAHNAGHILADGLKSITMIYDHLHIGKRPNTSSLFMYRWVERK